MPPAETIAPASTAQANDDGDIDETALVEVFEEMANESRSNHGSLGLNKNCHFCGTPRRRGLVFS